MKYLLIICLLLGAKFVQAQEKQPLDLEHIYHPDADAAKDLAAAEKQAAATHKHVLLQIGGNWCIWCKRFYKLTHDDAQLDSLMNANFVVYHLNYSKENKNLAILQSLGYPQRFGFPVIVILDAKGTRLHTQNTGLLEDADGYDKKKVAGMLKEWSVDALNPAHYTE
jgi:thioredoxin-related protein